jgi:uncharacterized protein (TIGR02001 family)
MTKPNRRLMTAALLGVVVTAAPARAEPAAETPAGEAADKSWIDQQIPGQIAGSVAFTTDYVFRGISQTDEHPAAQASLEYSYETDLFGITPYFGIWGSNVDFNDGDNATVELDWSFGLRGTVPIEDQEIGWNLGGVYYQYPGAGRLDGQASNYDYWEIATGLSWAPIDLLSFDVTYNYSPDFFGSTGYANYVNGTITVTPPNPYVDFAIFAGFGRQWISQAKDYNDWTIGATVTIKGVALTLQYIDTNLTQADLGGAKLSDARVVFTAGFAF